MTAAEIEEVIHEACRDAVCAGDHDYVLRAMNTILEAAAASCEARVECDSDYGGQFGGYRITDRIKNGPECAIELRAMKALR